MINLLPEEDKGVLRAARTNVVLLRYNLVTLAAIALLAAFCAVFYVILYNSQQKALATSDDNNKKSASLSDVRTAADSYRKNLTLAKEVLGNGTDYTDIIIAITKLLPPGTVLDNINLSSASFIQQTKFEAHATTYAAAEQLKEKFQSSSIFSNVYFESLTISTEDSVIAKEYPVTIMIDATLKKSGNFNEN